VIRVYLVDDHEVVRRGLRDLLVGEGDIRIVGGCGSVAEAVQQIPGVRPDVMVLDARLPDGTGVEICRAVRSGDPGIRALILTSFDDDEALLAAIVAGAAGYVLKQIRGSDLVHAIRRVAAGCQSLLDPALIARVVGRIRGGPEQPDELRTLTEEDRETLALIAEGLTDRQIAERTAVPEQTAADAVAGLLARLGLAQPNGAGALATKLLDCRPATA
jgi:two-component system response regulator DevR